MAYTAGPFDSPHLYLQWGGKLPGNESWSCGLRLAGPSATVLTDAISLLPAFATAISSFHTSTNTQISARCLLSEVKLNAIGTDGRYMASTTNQQVMADIPGSGAEGETPPNQIAMAVTTLTGFSRGPAHSGRFYVPVPVYAVTANGAVADVDANAMHTQAAALINAINAATGAPPTGWKVAVFSRKAGAPAHRLVTNVKVGHVLDTQRRRRRSLVEAYV